MTYLARNVEAAWRAMDTLLRGSSARSVMLRIPAPATPGDPAEQLGLATPQFQDVELTPVAFRTNAAETADNKAARRELLVSATAVEPLTGSQNFASAAELFASAFGIILNDALLAIVSATELELGGQICGYRLSLRETAPNQPLQ